MLNIPPPHEHLSNVTTRSLLLIFFGSILFPVFVVGHYVPALDDADWQPISDAVTSVSCYLLMLALLAVVAQSNLVQRQHLIPQLPPPHEWRRYIVLGVPMVASAIACIIVLYVPLSYVAPDFVSSWLLDEQSPFIWPRTDFKALLGSAGNLIALALLAPVAEEILFRGFMLNRFRHKLGTVAAVILSSLIFAVLHADLFGAFLFGVIVSAIYLQTGSLVGPILVHISNNTIVGFLALGDAVFFPDYTLTLADLQSYWWLAIVTGAIGFPWLMMYWRKHISVFERPSVQDFR